MEHVEEWGECLAIFSELSEELMPRIVTLRRRRSSD